MFNSRTRQRYPNTVTHINKMRPTPKAREGFQRYGGASGSAIDDAFTGGRGPYVRPAKIRFDATGVYENGIIYINEDIFEAFENGVPGSQTLLESTLQHELVHYFDDDGQPDTYEEGIAFEEYYYGWDIDNLEDAILFENFCKFKSRKKE